MGVDGAAFSAAAVVQIEDGVPVIQKPLVHSRVAIWGISCSRAATEVQQDGLVAQVMSIILYTGHPVCGQPGPISSSGPVIDHVCGEIDAGPIDFGLVMLEWNLESKPAQGVQFGGCTTLALKKLGGLEGVDRWSHYSRGTCHFRASSGSYDNLFESRETSC